MSEAKHDSGPGASSPPAPKGASNLAVRLATGLIGAPLILALLFKGPPWGFFLLVLPAALIGASELFAMTHVGDRLAQLLGVLVTAAVSLAVYFAGADARVLATVLAVVPVLGPLLTLVRLGDVHTAALRATAMSMAPLFVGVPLTLLAVMRRDLGDDGPSYVVLALMCAWLSDTGGYFAGRFLGKHKLYEAVSPKKTVEGSVGGLVAAALGAVVAHFSFLPSLPLVAGVAVAVVAAALGQAGDLGESLIKRATGVKDSGAIIPGHGGILDRVDALLCTAPVIYVYTLWLRG